MDSAFEGSGKGLGNYGQELDSPMRVNRFVGALVDEFLQDATGADRGAGLIALSARFPDRFKAAIEDRIGEIERQFGVTSTSPDRGMLAARQYGGHTEWRLIDEVVAAAAPFNLGSLSVKAKGRVLALVDATLAYGDAVFAKSVPLSSANPNREVVERYANRAHVKAVMQLQRGIWLLNESLAGLDSEIFALDDRADADQFAKERARELRDQLVGLQVWRRELERTLAQGAYERGAKRQGLIRLPRMPQIGNQVAADERRRQLVAVASDANLIRLARVA